MFFLLIPHGIPQCQGRHGYIYFLEMKNINQLAENYLEYIL